MSDHRQDAGVLFIEDAFRAMSIDTAWSTRQERGFTWWPYRLRQTVTASEPRLMHGAEVVRISAHTPVLRNVNVEQAVFLAVAYNAGASTSALVVDPTAATVGLHATTYLHPGNPWMATMFKAAIGYQVTQMEGAVDQLRNAMGGEIDDQEHPTSGRRREPDEMVELPAFYARVGREPLGYEAVDFERAAREVATIGAFATAGGEHLTAEVPYEDGPATALIQVKADETHPGLGHGLLSTLQLPISVEAKQVADLANQLNQAESDEWTNTPLLGAWTLRPPGIAFASFVPAFVLRGDGRGERKARIANAVTSMAIRARWAAGVVGES